MTPSSLANLAPADAIAMPFERRSTTGESCMLHHDFEETHAARDEAGQEALPCANSGACECGRVKQYNV